MKRVEVHSRIRRWESKLWHSLKMLVKVKKNLKFQICSWEYAECTQRDGTARMTVENKMSRDPDPRSCTRKPRMIAECFASSRNRTPSVSIPLVEPQWIVDISPSTGRSKGSMPDNPGYGVAIRAPPHSESHWRTLLPILLRGSFVNEAYPSSHCSWPLLGPPLKMAGVNSQQNTTSSQPRSSQV